MQLLGRMILEDLKTQHGEVAKQLDAWCIDVEASEWKSPHDVRKRYAPTDFPGNNAAIFNIKGNKYRILTSIDYINGIVLVKKAGTHTEYDSWRIK